MIIDSRTQRTGNASVEGTGDSMVALALRSPVGRAPMLAVTAPMHMTPHLDHHIDHIQGGPDAISCLRSSRRGKRAELSKTCANRASRLGQRPLRCRGMRLDLRREPRRSTLESLTSKLNQAAISAAIAEVLNKRQQA